MRYAVLSLFLMLTCAAEASALEVLTPRDGDTVAAKPTFTFDFTAGSASVEAATKRELLTAGDRAGYFVDAVADEFFLLPEDAPTGVATWSPAISAGRYFWHAYVNEYDDLGAPGVWTPVRTFTVRDEPILIEGWLLRAKRLRGTSKRCTRRVRFRGKVVYSDNSRLQEARWKLTVRRKGLTVKRFRGEHTYGAASFSGITCTTARKFDAYLTLTDPAGHTTSAEPKSVKA